MRLHRYFANGKYLLLSLVMLISHSVTLLWWFSAIASRIAAEFRFPDTRNPDELDIWQMLWQQLTSHVAMFRKYHQFSGLRLAGLILPNPNLAQELSFKSKSNSSPVIISYHFQVQVREFGKNLQIRYMSYPNHLCDTAPDFRTFRLRIVERWSHCIISIISDHFYGPARTIIAFSMAREHEHIHHALGDEGKIRMKYSTVLMSTFSCVYFGIYSIFSLK